MKRLLGLVLFGAFVAFSFPAYAGHDFMAEMRKNIPLIKEESCSNGLVKIEHRVDEMMGKKILMTLIIFEPDAVSKKSEFYKGGNKDFYSLIFYRISYLNGVSIENTLHYMKKAQSGDLIELDPPRWIGEISTADTNAAKSIMSYGDSDCVVIYPPQSR